MKTKILLLFFIIFCSKILASEKVDKLVEVREGETIQMGNTLIKCPKKVHWKEFVSGFLICLTFSVFGCGFSFLFGMVHGQEQVLKNEPILAIGKSFDDFVKKSRRKLGF